MHGITGIDHPVIAVADMNAARARYERMGFIVPPRGSHLEWGTGNWCIMFPDDYLELRGLVDLTRYTHGLDVFLAARGEGLMGVAFGTNDARATCESLTRSGVATKPVVELTRNFELPEGYAQPRFALCFPAETDTPGLMSVVMCQHLTPELIRRPEWLRHPNRVSGVVSMTAIVGDVDAVRRAHGRLFGEEAIAPTAGGFVVRVGASQSIHVLAGDVSPRLTSLTLRAAGLARLRACLEKGQIPFTEKAGRIEVLPAHTCGVILEFVQQSV